ncbi:MAG TPA: hypothetical protein QGF58_00530 [Myxococcota bacterium]|nr:hypothetical protein [Myxococcota bacterium]
MAKSRPSVQKRRAEAAKLEKKQAKAARKAARDAAKADRTAEAGVDPDLEGIVGGPQPRLYEGGDPIWHDDDLA